MSNGLEDAAWFDAVWMFAGLPLTILCIFRVWKHRWTSLTFLAWSLIPLYALHQFEEHGYDLLGRRYSFMNFFNAQTRSMGIALDPRLITIINVSTVWFIYPLCAIKAEFDGDFIPPAFCWGIAVFNSAIAHIMPAIRDGAYNPGSFQSLFMLPIGVLFLNKIRVHYGVWIVACAVLYGGPIAHGLNMLYPLRLIGQGQLSKTGFAVWLTFAALSPIFFSKFLNKLVGKEIKQHQR